MLEGVGRSLLSEVTAMFLSRDQARELDRRAIEGLGVPGVVLMENAGRNIAELLRAQGARGPVVICCGPGNNGGDGFVIARHLDNAGVPARVLLFSPAEKLGGDALVNYRVLTGGGVPVEILTSPDEAALRGQLNGADWIVDALFGSGQRGPLRDPFDRVVRVINASGVRVVAVDLPSGLDCDSGQPQNPTVRARLTATIAAPKKGFADPAAREWIGTVHVIDMGVPRRLLHELNG
jgi:NAD(P)H-hydrate epimerase